MNNWFQGQMDYIFFFCDLAFIGLGVICYILSKEVNQRLPWVWLALFGFTYGLSELLDFMVLAWPDLVWLGACRWAVMTVSFLFLLEFGRLSLIRRRGWGPGRWLLVILALLACLGALSGWNGLNATTRYVLGLVGSLWAGWALYTEGRQGDPQQRFWLLAGGVGLMLYGLVAGMIVPRVPFFPGTLVNSEAFTSLMGLPIQLVRGLLALWIAAMLVGYFQRSWPAEYEQSYRVRARYLYGAIAVLAVVLASGWVLTQHLGKVARKEVLQDAANHSNLIIQRLLFELEGADAAVKAMSGSPWISPALRSKSPQTLAQANSVLDRYQSRFGASPAYLLDQTGTAIASSNRGAPDSFVGHNYAFRPYFKQAMAGEPGRYFALGVTSQKRGFFAAYPVRDPVGKIVGVTAIKTTLDKFQQELRDSATAFLISPDGVIFLSSRPSLDYCSLWPINRPNKDDLKAQYGTADFKAVFPRPPKDGTTVKIDGESYLFYQRAINSFATAGWSLVLLAPVNLVVFYRFLGIATAFIGVVLTLLSFGTNLSIREGANRILASEARFRAMFVAAPEAVFVYDPETGKILEANPFMTQWLGYEPEELVGLEIDKVQAPESLGPQEELAREGSEGPHLSPGPRYRKRDGSLVDVECTAAKILHGDHIRELVFVRDITERKRTDAELKESLSLSKATLESTTDGLLVVNRQGRIVSANQKFGELWRIPEGITASGDAEQTLNYVSDQLLDPEGFLQKVKALYAQPAAKGFDVLHFKDGRVFERYSIPQYLDWEIVGRVWSFRDVTERIKAEEEVREANEQLQIMVNESERRTREATLITNMSEFLQSCLNFDEAYAIIAQSAQQLFAAVSGGLFMIDPAGNFLEMVTSWGETLAGEQVFAPNNCWAIRRGRIYLSGGSIQNEHCRHLPDKAGGCYFCLPLIAQEGAFGLLHLQAPGEGDSPVIDHIKDIALTLTDNISMALANLKLRETLHQQVIHDPLTGLFNRRYLEETLEREIHRIGRKRSTVGFIMMDLDHLKPFNDIYGHEAGDQLLQALGKFLKTQVRVEDIACRYGGDEFVLIMPEASLDITQQRAEEIRREVPHLQVVSQGRPLESSTISLGVAIFPDHGATVEDVLRAADDALYKAKAAGCNRVVVASERYVLSNISSR